MRKTINDITFGDPNDTVDDCDVAEALAPEFAKLFTETSVIEAAQKAIEAHLDNHIGQCFPKSALKSLAVRQAIMQAVAFSQGWKLR